MCTLIQTAVFGMVELMETDNDNDVIYDDDGCDIIDTNDDNDALDDDDSDDNRG